MKRRHIHRPVRVSAVLGPLTHFGKPQIEFLDDDSVLDPELEDAAIQLDPHRLPARAANSNLLPSTSTSTSSCRWIGPVNVTPAVPPPVPVETPIIGGDVGTRGDLTTGGTTGVAEISAVIVPNNRSTFAHSLAIPLPSPPMIASPCSTNSTASYDSGPFKLAIHPPRF